MLIRPADSQACCIQQAGLDIKPFSGIQEHVFFKACEELLRKGHKIKFRAPGRSMHPTIYDGDIITVEPVQTDAVRVGDILLYRTGENVIAHRVIAIRNRDPLTQSAGLNPQCLFFLRGDASRFSDEPVRPESILGKVISIDRNDFCMDLYSWKHKVRCWVSIWISRFKRFFKLTYRYLSRA
jgi:signal peptidase I